MILLTLTAFVSSFIWVGVIVQVLIIFKMQYSVELNPNNASVETLHFYTN